MKTLNDIRAKNILVVGDVMLDTYFFGDVKRISPEAPVPVFRKKSERSVAGGAANAAANLAAAGQNVSVMAMVGNDDAGEKLKSLFAAQGIDTGLILTLDRRTTEKTRFLAAGSQQVLRLDIEDTKPLDEENCQKMTAALEKEIGEFDLILISDYMKGLLTYDLTQSVIHMAAEYKIPVLADVKDKKIEKYWGAALLKPNLKELADLTGMAVDTDDQAAAASEKLRLECGAKYVLTTRGARGMVLTGDGEPYFVDAFGREVFDVTGAGDTAIAYMAACMANGFSARDAVNIANLAAGIKVSKVGTSPVSRSEIRERLAGLTGGAVHKMLDSGALESFRKDHADRKIVFTNGCFDILHTGHIRCLQEAAKLGDVLVVGLNSDSSVKRLKGPERPVNSQADRAEMLCALGFVDHVAVFEDDTPLELIRKLRPDVLVKGGDYASDEVVGRKEVEDHGGRVVILPLAPGKSTTGIIKRIKE